MRKKILHSPAAPLVVIGLFVLGGGGGVAIMAQGNPPPGGPATITEYTIPPGLAVSHGVATETGTRNGSRNIWFSVLTGDAVVQLDSTTGAEMTYAIPGGPHSGITDLRVTPTGEVWFNTGTGNLGSLNPTTGAGTLYLTGPAFVPALGFLDWIHVDQFGNVWSAELGGNRVLRFDPRTGAARTYTAGLGFVGLTGMTRRRSGDVWWSERGTGLIGRLDVRNNIITHYTTPFTALEGIALDPIGEPEGEVWVTPGFSGAPDAIGGLDPRAGTVTVYTTPTPNSNPYGITIGCAGSVVFGEDAVNQIGVLVPSLAVGAVFPTVAASAPVVPVSGVPVAVPFVAVVSTSVATITTGTSTAAIAGGFSEYPAAIAGVGLEGPHLVVIGPNEKIVYSRFFIPGGDVVGLLELPPAARCRQQ